jgi:glycosyltransferase involved in cell wall biosynthesis
MTRICFLIRQLDEGGAQRQLLTLIKGMDKTKFDITLMSFYEDGHFSEEVKSIAHVKNVCLKKSGRWDVFNFIYNLIGQLRKLKPDVIHGYLSLANCLTIFMKPFLSKAQMIFGVRASNMDLSHYDWLARSSYRVECFLSRFADLIIVNSKAGYDYAALQGFPKKNMIVIPNGIDTELFKQQKENGIEFREKWGGGNKETLIGLIGRIDPMKDHSTFFKAAEIVLKKNKNIRFVCIGDGPKPYKDELVALGERLGISNHLVWAGSLKDMPKVYNALDVVCSSSITEGFPNVIGEAMASGVPCVVTDVGDSAWIVGDTGVVVPPKNPSALAEGLLKCLDTHINIEMSTQARLRIEKNFSTIKLVDQIESTLCP